MAPGVRLVGWLFRTPKPRRGTLAGPKKLVLVPGAHHHDAPAPGAWPAIDASVASSWTQSD